MNLFYRLFGPNLTKSQAIQELKAARNVPGADIERIDRQLEELEKED